MCQKERRLALGWDITPTDDVFLPECKPDGSYKPVQCLQSEGPCWCVYGNGKEVPGTREDREKTDVSCVGKYSNIFTEGLITVTTLNKASNNLDDVFSLPLYLPGHSVPKKAIL